MIFIKTINIDDLEFKDGRYVYTFTPDKDMDAIELASDCMGDTTLDKIQVERNPDMTYFVPPEVYEGNISGIFKDLKEINLEMTDPNSDLWGRIKINAQGMIRDWHNNTTKVEIAETANGIATRITDLDKQLSNDIVKTAQGLQINLDDLEKNLSSRITTTASGLQAELKDLERGFNSQITSTANSLSSRINNLDGRYTNLNQTVNGINVRVGDLSKELDTQVSILKGQVASTVSRGDVQSIIQQSHNSIRLGIQDNLDGNVLKSRINMTSSAVKIDSKLIHLSGDTLIDNGVIKNAHIGDLSASKITTGILNAANVRIINLDVNNLTGNKTQFMQSLWRSMSRNVYIDGNGVRVVRNDNSTANKLNESGLDFFSGEGKLVGHIGQLTTMAGYGTDTLFIGVPYGNKIDLGYYTGASIGSNYRAALQVSPKEGSNNHEVQIFGDLIVNGKIREMGWGN